MNKDYQKILKDMKTKLLKSKKSIEKINSQFRAIIEKREAENYLKNNL